ncbi:D-inositol-3-phosphate glycosyltransferase [Microlunatus parietis]|uniref:D-inositol-3-phosphate glycosyltransferase n=1 Tax=Microlunatus parietis TaxID=682979 RepID=A0A7Y9LBS2_9ACTN|nr:D-inositol-3-phosphate glycosyltransferase [Microlunatus parietis]NYE70950.1 D-inositol-3-phosphate glycosyltransferase [Microlunatus parietis]
MPRSRPKPDRVAMISLHTSPLATPGVGDAGGLNVYVAELATALGRHGVEVEILTRRSDPATPEVVPLAERVTVRHLAAGPPEPVAKEQLPGLVDEFAASLRPLAAGYDLIHSHYWLSGLAALRVDQDHHHTSVRPPLVHTMHTMARVKNAALADDQQAEPEPRADGEALIVKSAEGLTANTGEEAAELRDHYGAAPDRITIVPPGVDLDVFHPCDQRESRDLLDIGAEAEVILFVGRIQPLKAPDVLIRAVAELIKQQPRRRERLKLIIIGSPSGPDRDWADTLPELADSLQVGELVEFRPHSERLELYRWYCASDIVAVPSHNESFGLVALEAQACTRPVVAADVGGLRHAVADGRTGILVGGHGPQDWASALGSLLDDPDRAVRLGQAGIDHARGFSWDASAEATLRAYRTAMG